MEVLDLKQMAQDAIALHQQGKLDQAEALYMQILGADPALFGPRYYMGILRMQQKVIERGFERLPFAEIHRMRQHHNVGAGRHARENSPALL